MGVNKAALALGKKEEKEEDKEGCRDGFGINLLNLISGLTRGISV